VSSWRRAHNRPPDGGHQQGDSAGAPRVAESRPEGSPRWASRTALASTSARF
jgi:hypothetical protein